MFKVAVGAMVQFSQDAQKARQGFSWRGSFFTQQNVNKLIQNEKDPEAAAAKKLAQSRKRKANAKAAAARKKAALTGGEE